MIITGYKCAICGDTVFSRTTHDCRNCSCGAMYVDGGFEYLRLGAKDPSTVKSTTIELPVTKKQLYDDWNNRKDKYGIIKEDK